jgi:hypothetical protein
VGSITGRIVARSGGACRASTSTVGEITERLGALRQAIERDWGPVQRLSLDVAVILDDVAVALGLDEDQVRRVLGDDAYAAIYEEPAAQVVAAAAALFEREHADA